MHPTNLLVEESCTWAEKLIGNHLLIAPNFENKLNYNYDITSLQIVVSPLKDLTKLNNK